jgi:hypothetical protein
MTELRVRTPAFTAAGAVSEAFFADQQKRHPGYVRRTSQLIHSGSNAGLGSHIGNGEVHQYLKNADGC